MSTSWTLTWRIDMDGTGYTAHQLLDDEGGRWGYAVNAPLYGWMAHIGSFGMGFCPIDDEVVTTLTLKEAKEWIEETIATRWRDTR